MEDPRVLPAPALQRQRIRAFALDLAYGHQYDKWSSRFYASRGVGANVYHILMEEQGTSDIPFAGYLKNKWKDAHPDPNDLVAADYLVPYVSHGAQQFILTEHALYLLESLQIHPGVFISYRQEESAALALLVRDRLRAMDIDVFIDEDIEGGNAPWDVIETQIKTRSALFLSILAANTLEAKGVQREYDFALEAGLPIELLIQPSFKRSQLPNTKCDARIKEAAGAEGYVIQNENTQSYLDALNRLLEHLRKIFRE